MNLKGKYFTQLIQPGETVTVGTPLVNVDFEQIKNDGYDIITPIIITNSELKKEVISTTNEITFAGEPILELK